MIKQNLLFANAAIGILITTLGTMHLSAHAVQPLQGRTVTGTAVASTDPLAVMEYDPNLNVTWLRDWNSAGAMTWSAASAWAATLTVGAFGGWSLPSFNANDTGCSVTSNPSGFPSQHYGYNCTLNPLGYLYYTEGIGWGIPGPFKNIQNDRYFSKTEYVVDTSEVWVFGTGYGYESRATKPQTLFAVAIRAGDVAAVPEPQSWAMMIFGLGLGYVLRKRQQAENIQGG